MKPYILRHTVHRTDNTSEPTYSYDHEKSLNIINVGGGVRPFIDSEISPVTLGTATKVKGESDRIPPNLIEMTTGTRVKQEKNDRQPSLLELTTKTMVKSESDD